MAPTLLTMHTRFAMFITVLAADGIKVEDVRPHGCLLFSGLFLVQSVMIV
jgi:hypothetical protein